MAAFARLLAGRIIGIEEAAGPVLPLHGVPACPRPAAAERDRMAGIRMPPSFTDRCLHYMEIGRGAPLVAVTVKGGATQGT